MVIRFRKKYLAGLNNLRTTAELRVRKLDKKLWGMCRVLKPVREFCKKNVAKNVWK